MKTALSRRGLLKGAALGVTAVVLGWRPEFPAAEMAPAAPPVAASVGQIAKMRSYVMVSREIAEDTGAEPLIHAMLRRALTRAGGLTLIEPAGPERFERGESDVMRHTTFRLTQDWRAVPVNSGGSTIATPPDGRVTLP